MVIIARDRKECIFAPQIYSNEKRCCFILYGDSPNRFTLVVQKPRALSCLQQG